MAYRVLELTLLSARDLKKVNLVTPMEVYAVASISGDPLTRQGTPADRYGGRHPEWNTTLRFAVPAMAAAAAASGAFLHVLLRAERPLGDRDVGEVVVRLADLLGGAGAGPQPLRYASYQVRKVHCTAPHGVLNLAYRFGAVVEPQHKARTVEPVLAYPAAPYYPPQPYTYPPPPPPPVQPSYGYPHAGYASAPA